MKIFIYQMNYTMIKNLLVTCILSFYFCHQCIQVFAAFEDYDCFISNNLPYNDYLRIHVFSGNDDLKYHNLTSSDDGV